MKQRSGLDHEGRFLQPEVPQHRAQRLRSDRRRSIHRRLKKTVHAAYPNNSDALTTGGGLVFTGLIDGTLIAYDDTTLAELWKINVGSGFNAPPMTFETGGKQYVAILTGISPITKTRHVLTPELREMRNQTMLFVFGL